MRAGLKPRDVALAKALNTDKLTQLFVKVDGRTLDGGLAAPHAHPDLPEEARSLVVLKRGTGAEHNTGLLFVEKLDYLQLLAVEAVRDCAVAFWKGFVEALKDLSEVTTAAVPPAAAAPQSDTHSCATSPARPCITTAARRMCTLLL